MHLPVSEKTDVFGIQLETQFIPAPAGQERPVLVFLHEGLGSVRMWRDWPRSLCQQLGCAGWVYSRQGYGQSDAVADVRGPAQQSPDDRLRSGRLLPDYMHREAQLVLPELLDRWGVQKPVLIGHSDGGTIALLHAAHRDVHACIAMAPHVMVEDMSIQAIEMAREAFEKGSLRERLQPFHADVDCAFWQWNDVWLSEGFRSFDIRNTLTRIGGPVLTIQGVEDPYGSMAQIDEIARHAPQTQQVKLAGCGHSPHRDQPMAVNQAIGDFLKPLRV